MNKSKLFLLLLTPALLCGCTSKCTFQEYKDKVSQIDFNAIPDTSKIELTFNDGKEKEKITVEGTVNEVEMKLLVNPHELYYSQMLSAGPYVFSMGWGTGDSNIDYFIGLSGFKVIRNKDGEKNHFEFDKYGHCTRFILENSEEKVTTTAKYFYVNK